MGRLRRKVNGKPHHGVGAGARMGILLKKSAACFPPVQACKTLRRRVGGVHIGHESETYTLIYLVSMCMT